MDYLSSLESSLAQSDPHYVRISEGHFSTLDVLVAWQAHVDSHTTAFLLAQQLENFDKEVMAINSLKNELTEIPSYILEKIATLTIGKYPAIPGELLDYAVTSILEKIDASHARAVARYTEIHMRLPQYAEYFGAAEIASQEIRMNSALSKIYGTVANMGILFDANSIRRTSWEIYKIAGNLSELWKIIEDAAKIVAEAADSRVALSERDRTTSDAIRNFVATIPVFGTDLSDRIIGSSLSDTIFGDDGEDEIKGGGGDDRIYGGDKADSLYGEDGIDYIFPGLGHDTVDGGPGSDIIYGSITDLNSDTLYLGFGDRVEVTIPDGFGPVTSGMIKVEFTDDPEGIASVLLDPDGDGFDADELLFFVVLPANQTVVLMGQQAAAPGQGSARIVLEVSGFSGYTIDQPLTSSGLRATAPAFLGALSQSGIASQIGTTLIDDSFDPELRNLAVTPGGAIYTVIEYQGGENLAFGAGHALPPLGAFDVGGAIVQLDPITGAFVPGTVRGFSGMPGGDVPDTAPDFGVYALESVNALAPIGETSFLAIGEFNFRAADNRTLEGGSDFAFRIAADGTTTFLAEWSIYGDAAGTRTIGADTHPTSGKVYAWRDYVNYFGGGVLLEVNTTTGVPSVVHDFFADGSGIEIRSISFAPDGTLVGHGAGPDFRSTFFRIDGATGTITPLGYQSGGYVPREFDLIGQLDFARRRVGTSRDDTMQGTDAADDLDGGPGDDELQGLGGDDRLTAGGGTDTLAPGAGADRVDVLRSTANIVGTPAEMSGDVIVGFDDDDAITLSGTEFELSDVSLTYAPLVIAIDSDGDGGRETTITLEGGFAPDTLIFTQPDGDGGTRIRLAARNRAPAAKGDVLAVGAGRTGLLDLLANDSDAEGDALKLTAIAGIAIPADGITEVPLPSGAMIRALANGLMLYEPNGAFAHLAPGTTATDSFSYTVADPGDAAAMAGVVVTVTGQAAAESASVAIALANVVKAEGNTGTVAFTFAVTRAGETTGSATVDWSVAGLAASGVMAADAGDFPGLSLPSGTVAFAPGETQRLIDVLVRGDAAPEMNERFAVTLSNPSAGTALAQATAHGTILTEDGSRYSIGTSTFLKLETTDGVTEFVFTVTRAGLSHQTDTLEWSVAGGGMPGTMPTSATDFLGDTMPSGMLGFAPGENRKTITISVEGDTIRELNESFTVSLANPSSGAAIGRASATVGIIDDDTIRVSGEGDTATGTEASDYFLIGPGSHFIYGLSATDRFVFADAIGTTTLHDFAPTAGERIDLRQIDAIATTLANDAFTFIGTAAFSGTAGQLRWQDEGATRLIQGDVNGDTTADLIIFINTVGPVDAQWFVL